MTLASTSTSTTTNERIIITRKTKTAAKSQAQQQQQTQEAQEAQLSLARLESKITIVTDGFIDFVIKKLRSLDRPIIIAAANATTTTITNNNHNNNYNNYNKIGRQNIETICDYLIAMTTEVNPSLMHKRNQMQVLCYLSEHYNNLKPFKQMTSNDIISYLDTLRKPESLDSDHKWIGTYNLRRVYFIRFFKWLYNSNLINPDKRLMPNVMKNIPQLK